MKALEMFEPYWAALKRFFIYAQYCIDSDMHAPVCRDFWIWVVCASFALAALIALVIGRKVIREQLQFYRTRKRLEARKIVADEETMEEFKWKGQ